MDRRRKVRNDVEPTFPAVFWFPGTRACRSLLILNATSESMQGTPNEPGSADADKVPPRVAMTWAQR